MALIHARLASKKADPFLFQLHAVGAYLSDDKLPWLVWSTPLATSMCPAMASSNFPTGTPLIFLSMMIQGDDGYGEMAIVMMTAIVMMMKKRLRLVSRLGNSQCGHWFSLVCTDGDDETNTVFGEEGEMTKTGLLPEPFVSSYRR